MEKATRPLPRGVWLLGLVSLCMDLSSEMIHALLPVFLASVLGAGMETIGLIEGVAEATASISKLFSGALSDRFSRRKPLVLAGYGLAALTKPLFPLAQSAAWVFVARFVDRVGKGIRGAPRDALITDLTEPTSRGAAFGLRQALDTAGALLGPLVALGLMAMLGGGDDAKVRTVFLVAAVPALAAVAVLAFFVHEPAENATPAARRAVINWNDVRRLGASFWFVAVVGSVFALARFSEAFLILKASDVGLSLVQTPLALAVMNLTYVASAYPFGKLADRVDRVAILAGGLVLLIVADLTLAWAQSVMVALVGIALWGLHMGMTQGLLSAMVAGAAPRDLRGSAFGVFYFLSGVAALLASLMAGALWKFFGPAATFFTGAGLSGAALVALAASRRFHDST